MPTYDYRCQRTGEIFEKWQSFGDAALTNCILIHNSDGVECDAPVKRVFSKVGISFKGEGFYKNDHGSYAKARAKEQSSSESAKKEKSASDTGADGSGSSSSSGESSSSSESPGKGSDSTNGSSSSSSSSSKSKAYTSNTS